MRTRRRALRIADLRGVSRLAVEGTIGATDLVEEVHRSLLRLPRLGANAGRHRGQRRPLRGISGFVYRTVRGIARLVGRGVDGGLAALSSGSARTEPPPRTVQRDALVAALNGVLGDHLAASGNPLAIPMTFRRDGEIARPERGSGGRVLLLLHGLCKSDLHWQRRGHDHGARLAEELGFTQIYLNYNSGRAIPDNGRELALRLETFFAAWPEPVTELVAVAHSMGGLVMRSACAVAEAEGFAWRAKLRKIVFLGTPHRGAPLERGGNWLTLALETTSYSAAFGRLARVRSAGITDLRFGRVEAPAEGARSAGALALPTGVACYAVAATLARSSTASASASHSLLGDGLVPLPSALGEVDDPAQSPAFPAERRFIARGANHLELLDRADVYAQIAAWLAAPPR